MKIIDKINFDFTTTQQLFNLINEIDSFKVAWNILEIKENFYLRELRKIATIESIGSSTRIEGAKLNDEEVEKILDNIKITKFTSRDEEEVFGYYEALELIIDSFEDISLSESNIQTLHNILLKYTSKDERHKGKYKQLSNQVIANYPGGVQRLIFKTTEPHLTPKEMEELIMWTNQAFEEKTIHPLLTIGTFVYEFLSIHPFQDGNGRLSRLLTTLLLLQNNYPFIKYISFENLIEQKKSEYYRALMEGQKNRYKDNEKINEWLLFFMQSLKTLTQRLEAKYNVYKNLGGYLNERQKSILSFIEDNKPVKISDIVKAFPDIKEGTVKKDVAYLRTENYISSLGKGKATVYITIDNN